MKKALVSVLFLFAFSSLFSQTFSLTDTNIVSGGYYRSYNLLFDLGKATLRQESFSHLDSVFTFLNKNPTVKLEIGVHTDSRNCEQEISRSYKIHEARAKSIADYLFNKGISADQLISKGYSCYKLLVPDAEIKKLKTKEEIEAAHQKNRRVEFTIIAI